MNITTSNTVINFQDALMKLERNNTSIYKYLQKLRSYTCEPTDYGCFIQMRQLQDDLARLAYMQKRFCDDYRDKKEMSLLETRKIKEFDYKYHQLESQINSYLSKSNAHF